MLLMGCTWVALPEVRGKKRHGQTDSGDIYAPPKRKNWKIRRNKDFQVFLDFEVWVKDFQVFDLRFGLVVKNCIYFTPCILIYYRPEKKRTLITGGVINWTSGLS